MKRKNLLTVNSVFTVVSGAACVLVPVQLLAHDEVTLSPMGIAVYPFRGATLIGLGMLVAGPWWCCSASFQRHAASSSF